MTETIQMNVVVLPVTKERVERMARDTFRGKGDLIDWMVDKTYKEMYPETVIVTIDQAQEAAGQS